MVVRGHAVGDTDVLQPSTVVRADQRAGGGERQSHVRGQREAQVRGTAGQLSARDVRDHGRVLETRRHGPAEVFRDTLVPAAEKSRVHPGGGVERWLSPVTSRR